MGLRNIVEKGDPALRKTAREITDVNDHIRQILDDLADTMYEADGVGLAAPQVGILRRMCVVDIGDRLYELVNPRIVESEGDQYGEEGCLSVPGYSGSVHRPMKVKVWALDRNGNPAEYSAEGLLARAFCHEIDHLDGVLYIDKADNVHRNGEDPEEE